MTSRRFNLKRFANGFLVSALLVFCAGVRAGAEVRSCLTPLLRSLQVGQFGSESQSYLRRSEDLRRQLVGLDHRGIIPWSPNEANELNRDLVRYHQVESRGTALPTFDRVQPLGPATVRARDIRFSQVTAANQSGEYTVIGNAQALRNGTLSVEAFPPLRVWRDTEGRIWTLDHRRLAAMRLSGRIDEIPVEFVREEVVRQQAFKFTTQSEGRAMIIVDETPGSNIAVVVGDETVPLVPGNIRSLVPPTPAAAARARSIDNFLTNIPTEQRAAWLRERGGEHVDRLKEYADEIARAYATVEEREVRNLGLSYARFGDFRGRGKSYDSVLTKLLRKDFEAFERGLPGIDSLNTSLATIGDGIGVRLNFRVNAAGAVDPRLIQEFVDQVVIDIRNGNRVTEIQNFRPRGDRAAPYLTDEQIRQIVRADAEYIKTLRRTPGAKVPPPIVVRSGIANESPSGYTSFHMNIRYKSGLQAEFQARGPRINTAAEVSHLFYDLNSGKPLSQFYQSNPAIVRAADTYRRLTAKQRERYIAHVEEQIIHARRIETGAIPAATQAPRLPSELPAELAFENLTPHLAR